MALYKHQQYIGTSNHKAFDAILKPGVETPYSGIYHCEGCGKELASTGGNPLPPQNHH